MHRHHPAILHVDGGDLAAVQRHDVPSRRIVPCRFFDGDVLCGDGLQQLFGQRGAVVGEGVLAGQHDDQPAPVGFADGLCGGKGGNATTEDEITLHKHSLLRVR